MSDGVAVLTDTDTVVDNTENVCDDSSVDDDKNQPDSDYVQAWAHHNQEQHLLPEDALVPGAHHQRRKYKTPKLSEMIPVGYISHNVCRKSQSKVIQYARIGNSAQPV